MALSIGINHIGAQIQIGTQLQHCLTVNQIQVSKQGYLFDATYTQVKRPNLRFNWQVRITELYRTKLRDEQYPVYVSAGPKTASPRIAFEAPRVVRIQRVVKAKDILG